MTSSLCRASDAGATSVPRWQEGVRQATQVGDVGRPVAPPCLVRQALCPGPAPPPSSLTFLFFPLLPEPRGLLMPSPAIRPLDPPKIRRFVEGKVGEIVPHPSPKVLPLFFLHLTMYISSY